MWAYLTDLLSSNALAPHGYCLSWRPGLVWTHVLSDALIGASYVTIATTLALLVKKRDDIAFSGIFWCFAAFILLCGGTHFFSILTFWYPYYGAEGLLKAMTALVSAATAVVLVVLVPRILTLPSPQTLRIANAALEREMAERVRTEAMLRQAQKIEVVGQLTGGVAHDFNNLLTVIGGNVELLGRTLGETVGEKVDRYLANASRGVAQAKELTSRLLAFSRRQTLDPQATDVNALITEMSDLMVRTLGEAVEIDVQLPQDVWPVEVDRNQLESAILNLAVNARDAMTKDGLASGKLTIETANTQLDTIYARDHVEVAPGDYVVICVSDTGAGMAPEVIEQALEPFFTTKEVGKGTGLGLSQVFGFIKQSGGHLKIYSEVGFGTCVKLYLPRLASDGGVVALPREVGSSAPRAQGETVLVVEDDPNVRSYVTESLRELGYVVNEAARGSDALDLLRGGAAPDLLVTDVVMPGMTGRQVADAALAIHPGLPILFMTGYARNAIAHGGRLDAGVLVLVKPFTLTALAVKVREALTRRARSDRG